MSCLYVCPSWPWLTVSKYTVFGRGDVAVILIILIWGSNLNSRVVVEMKAILGFQLLLGLQALRFSGDFWKGDGFAYCWWLVCNGGWWGGGGGICVGTHLFRICLSNQFHFHWKPIFKVPYIDSLWAIVTTYTYSSLLLVISHEIMAADLSMIRKIHGGSPLSLIHHLETWGGHSSQCGYGGPGVNKVKAYSKLKRKNSIRYRKTQGPGSSQN